MKFKGNLIITDPCYIIKKGDNDDWHKCNYGSNMEALGIKNYLTADTEYGDWSCTTVKDDPQSQELVTKLNTMYTKFFSDYNNPDIYQTKENRADMYENYTKERELMIKDSGLVIGLFCADAGLVSVFLLDEVLKYNPRFDYHLKKSWTTTLVEDFDGEVEITHRKDGVSVVGKGNINFYTTQTGL